MVLDELANVCSTIGPYLVPDSLAYVKKTNEPLGEQSTMLFDNMPRDGGHLFLDSDLAAKITIEGSVARLFIKRFVGSNELINGRLRYCLWIEDEQLAKVEVVATYKLAGLNRTRMEKLFHKLFAAARLDITINDRFGHPVQPQEWFLVPVFVIDEVVQRIKDGTITGDAYDRKTATLVKAG